MSATTVECAGAVGEADPFALISLRSDELSDAIFADDPLFDVGNDDDKPLLDLVFAGITHNNQSTKSLRFQYPLQNWWDYPGPSILDGVVRHHQKSLKFDFWSCFLYKTK